MTHYTSCLTTWQYQSQSYTPSLLRKLEEGSPCSSSAGDESPPSSPTLSLTVLYELTVPWIAVAVGIRTVLFRDVLARVGAGGVESFEAIVSMLSVSFFFSHSALTRPLRLSLSYFAVFRPQRIPASPSNVSASSVSMTTRSDEVRGAPPPSPKMMSTCGTLGSDGRSQKITIRPQKQLE